MALYLFVERPVLPPPHPPLLRVANDVAIDAGAVLGAVSGAVSAAIPSAVSLPSAGAGPAPAAPRHRRLLKVALLGAISGAVLGATLYGLLWCYGAALPAGLPTDANAWLAQRGRLLALSASSPWSVGAGLFGLMTLLSLLALPGCSVLALAAGLCFGTLAGTLLVVTSSTAGATLAFLAARHGWRDAVQARWGRRLAPIEAALARDGAMFLFSLRLVPVIPYPLINPLMGLTGIALRPFIVASLLGMLAGSAVYAHAGAVLGDAQVLQDIVTPGVLASLAVLAVLPWIGRRLMHARSAAARPVGG